MDGPIRRVEPPNILPLAGPGRVREGNGRGGKRFALDPEADTETDAGEVPEETSEETSARPLDHDRRVAPAPDDEAGSHVDVTA